MQLWIDYNTGNFVLTIELTKGKFLLSKDSWRFSGPQYNHEQMENMGYEELEVFQ